MVTSTARTVEADSRAMRNLRLLSIASFASIVVSFAVVVGCSSSSDSGTGTTTTDSGSAYDGPYDDIVTTRPDSDTTIDSGAEAEAGADAVSETATDAEAEAEIDAADAVTDADGAD